ncbi:MAG TPA: hypothetical protein VKH42_14290 [Vicinamibacterales bacterium]|nr:hypothetical protein [Vicinamibacterales bacterium]
MLVSICLLWASSAIAATAPRGSKTVCDPQSTAARRLVRHPRSFGGPIKLPPERTLLGLDELTPRVAHGAHANLGDENQAIQNDAPAARMEADDQPVPALHIVGLLVGSVDPHTRTLACSPKSPRGPPVAA